MEPCRPRGVPRKLAHSAFVGIILHSQCSLQFSAWWCWSEYSIRSSSLVLGSCSSPFPASVSASRNFLYSKSICCGFAATSSYNAQSLFTPTLYGVIWARIFKILHVSGYEFLSLDKRLERIYEKLTCWSNNSAKTFLCSISNSSRCLPGSIQSLLGIAFIKPRILDTFLISFLAALSNLAASFFAPPSFVIFSLTQASSQALIHSYSTFDS